MVALISLITAGVYFFRQNVIRTVPSSFNFCQSVDIRGAFATKAPGYLVTFQRVGANKFSILNPDNRAIAVGSFTSSFVRSKCMGSITSLQSLETGTIIASVEGSQNSGYHMTTFNTMWDKTKFSKQSNIYNFS